MKDGRISTRFVNDDGQYVVWPLHSPAVPGYGDWAFVTLQFGGGGRAAEVTFVRPLTNDEINQIRRSYMVWGGKLFGVPWAMVWGNSDSFGDTGIYNVVASAPSRRSVGV